MADENMITFEMVFNHNIMFNVEGDNLIYDKAEQDIVLREFSIFPELDIDRMEVVAQYDGKAEDVIKNSLSKVATGNVSMKNKPEPESTQEPVQETVETSDVETGENTNINNKKRSFNIITNRLKVSKQFSITKGSKDFTFEFKPKEITKFINYVESKKIKIFIDGNEVKPKAEIEFLKEVIPMIKAKVYLK